MQAVKPPRGDTMVLPQRVTDCRCKQLPAEVFFWPELFGEAEMRRMHDWMEADLQASSCHACPALHVPLLLRCLPGRRSLEVIQRMGAPACCKHANCLVALLRVAWLLVCSQ